MSESAAQGRRDGARCRVAGAVRPGARSDQSCMPMGIYMPRPNPALGRCARYVHAPCISSAAPNPRPALAPPCNLVAPPDCSVRIGIAVGICTLPATSPINMRYPSSSSLSKIAECVTLIATPLAPALFVGQGLSKSIDRRRERKPVGPFKMDSRRHRSEPFVDVTSRDRREGRFV